MPPSDPAVSECCRYCPHLESVQGSCGHDLRQALVREFRRGEESSCPVYGEHRAERMAELADHLP